MEQTAKRIPKNKNSVLKRIRLACEGYEPVAFSARPRFFHAPIHVSNAIGKPFSWWTLSSPDGETWTVDARGETARQEYTLHVIARLR